MPSCDARHAEYDRIAGGKIQVGTLPNWTRVQGKVAWRVVQGPYSNLPAAWHEFIAQVGEQVRGPPAGPSGDVYVCSPEDHASDRGAKILTLLYLPVG
jgi:hypothetical protein